MTRRDIIFRARRKDNGEWVIGSYLHIKRKGNFHLIKEFESNENFEVYRESLQMKNWEEKFEDI